MKDSTALESLLQLEAHYFQREAHYGKMLRNVRELIEDARGGGGVPAHGDLNGKNIVLERVDSHSELAAATAPRGRKIAPETSLAHLTKANAVLQVLAEINSVEFDKDDMFEELTRRGHSVKNTAALVSMLSSDPRFVSEGQGVWSLTEPELNTRNAGSLLAIFHAKKEAE